jgi:secreted PhoX family phosphatase
MNMKIVTAGVAAAIVGYSSAASAAAESFDFGSKVEELARDASMELFGIRAPLGKSTSTSLTGAQIDADPTSVLNVAPGLRASVVSNAANLGANIDMMALWPNDRAPTHIIACNEQGSAQVGVQRVNLRTGVAEDIISSGLTSCDPVEITAWGTIVVGEENGSNGRAFEILDPLATTGVTVTGAGATTTTSDPAHVRYLAALGQLSFEGISVLPNGVVLYQDENRPGASDAGGGYFKFVPDNLWSGGAAIANLGNSPLAGGRVFGLRIGRNSGNSDVGLGNHTGRGVWVEVVNGQIIGSTTINRINLRAAATAMKLSVGYRPEDQDIDKGALANGKIRVCGTNTGQDIPATTSNGDNNYGETFCITDGTLAESAVISTGSQTLGGVTYTVNNGAGTSVPEYQTLVHHYPDFAMPDNVAYQPGRGNWIINEDGEGALFTPPRNNDIFACTDDGDDADVLADACVKVMSLNDLTAETTGGVFDASGTAYYFSVQHNATGHGLILKVTGWR